METPPPQQPPQQPAPQPTPMAPQPNYAPPAGPTIRFDVIGQAFSMVFADAGIWIVSALLLFVVMIAVNIVLTMLTVGILLSGGFLIAIIFRVITIALVMAISYIFMANMYRMAIKSISGGKPSVNDLFKFEGNLGNVVTAAFVVGALTGIGFMFCVIPGLIIGGLSMFTLPLVVDKGMPAMQAFSTSIEMLKKDVVMAAIFFLVAWFCSVIVFGLTLAVMPIAISLLYRDYFGFSNAPASTSSTA